jgi:putative ABC transport system permease protein
MRMRDLRFWRWQKADDDDLDRELEVHLELAIEERLEAGAPLRDARLAARREFGSVALTKEDLREMRVGAGLDRLWQDIRYGLRTMRRHPGFTTVVLLTLALGIGANSAMFALVDATLLRPLPFAESDRLMVVWERFGSFQRAAVAPLNFRDWSERNATFQSMAAAFPYSRRMTGLDGTVEQIRGQQVTPRFFDVLGIRAIAGRTFLPVDVALPPNVVVLSEGLWRTRFSGDPTLVGRTIRLDGQPFTVVGIVPAASEVLAPSSLWTVWTELPGMDARSLHFMRVIGRLKPDVTRAAAQRDMTAVAASLGRELPSTNKDRGIVVEPLRDGLISGEVRLTAILFLGVVGFVLLMCCANVASLLMARMSSRAHELAIRSALGASRRRIVAQVLTESVTLAALGGVIGAGVGAAILKTAPSAIPPELLPAAVKLAFDGRVAAFCAVTTCLTGLLFGLMPAWQVTSTALVQVITSQSRTATGGSGLRTLLTVAEVATAVLLLCGAGLLLRTLMALDRVDAGYRAESVLTMQVNLEYGLPNSRYSTQESLRWFFDAVERDVARLPGVRSVGWGSGLPLDGESLGGFEFEVVGEPQPATNRPSAEYQIVSPSYLETLDVPIIAGRGLSDGDTAEGAPVCLVSEAFARRYVPGKGPVGLRVAIRPMVLAPAQPVVRQIVGVVGQIKRRPDEAEDSVDIYVPQAQNVWSSAALVVRPSRGSAEALAPAVRAAVARVDNAVPVTQVRTLDDVAQQATARPRFRAVMVGGFAGLALLLAMVGVFGILAYSVQQRVREFAVRMALGASMTDVLRLVVASAIRVIGAGVVIGLALAAVLGQSLATFLFGVQPLDSITFGSVMIVVAVTAAIATVAPAWRAARTDPAVALRSD